MEKLPVEISGFHYALGYLDGIIESDRYNESLKMSESDRLEYMLISLKDLRNRMVELKKSAVSKTV